MTQPADETASSPSKITDFIHRMVCPLSASGVAGQLQKSLCIVCATRGHVLIFARPGQRSREENCNLRAEDSQGVMKGETASAEG